MPLPRQRSNTLSGNSFLIFFTRFFPSLANLLVLIWYSRHLPPMVYGSYQRFWIQLNVLYPLACFGIHVLIITYSRSFTLDLFSRIKKRHIAMYTAWLAAVSLAFAMLVSHSLNITFAVPFLFMLCYSLSIILESFLIVCRSYSGLVIINILYSAAFCFIHWFVLRNGFSLAALFSFLFIIVAVRLLCYIAISLNYSKQKDVLLLDHVPEGTAVRSLWLHLGFYDVTQMLFSWIDKFIISLVLTASLSAVYFNGSQNIPFLPLLLSAAGSAVLIQMATIKKQDETENIILFMNRSGRVLSCIVFPLFFFLLLFRHEIIITLLTAKYAAAIPVFAVSILVLPLKAYSYTTILQRLHKGSIINAGSVADLLLACALMYPLYKWLGLPGVALSFVITTYLQAGFYLFCSARLLHTTALQLIPYTDWIIKLIVFASLFIAIHYAAYPRFTQKIALLLGGAAMVVMIAVALFAELIKQKKYGRS